MTKQELKVLYKTKKITAKEYFSRLGKLLSSESPVLDSYSEINAIFDGRLPLRG